MKKEKKGEWVIREDCIEQLYGTLDKIIKEKEFSVDNDFGHYWKTVMDVEDVKELLTKQREEIKKGNVCKWGWEGDREEGIMATECGEAFCFDGSPEENKYKYCPTCGKTIVDMATKQIKLNLQD